MATVLAISCILAAPAAPEQLPLARFTLADGLAGDLVTHLYQDRTGFLWIATQSGLSRFDGQRFISYDTRHGLPDAIVRQVLETTDGRLWVATRGGLARLEPRAEDDAARFRAWTFGPGLENSIAGLVEDSHGRLWLGSGDRVLQVLEEKGEVRFRRLPLEVEFAEPHGRVRTIVEGPDESLWIATRAGVVRVLPDGGQRPYPLDDPRRLRFDADGTLWVSLARQDVLALRPGPAVDGVSGIDWAARYAAATADPDPGCRAAVAAVRPRRWSWPPLRRRSPSRCGSACRPRAPPPRPRHGEHAPAGLRDRSRDRLATHPRRRRHHGRAGLSPPAPVAPASAPRMTTRWRSSNPPPACQGRPPPERRH